MAALQARHATALRSYALELWDGDAKRADESLGALWREWAKAPPAADDANARETVFAALRRHVVAQQRRAGAHPGTEHDDDTETGDDDESATARVARRFRQLTPKQQEVLRLRLRHHFGPDEIAHITELSSAAIHQLIHHALARLDGGPGDDPRLTRLALGGATPAETAGENPADRARVAELRLTAEVARQVLARGVETFVTRKRRRSRRKIFVATGVAAAALVAVGFFLLRSRTPDHEIAATEIVTASGASRVAIARREAAEAPSTARGASVAANSENGGRGFMPRRSGHETPVASARSTSEPKAPPAVGANPAASGILAPAADTPPRSNIDSSAHAGISTGEVSRAEPSAQRRGEMSAEKVSAPPAQPLGRADAGSVPPAPGLDRKDPLPQRSGSDAPAAPPSPTSGHKAPPTAQAPLAAQASPAIQALPGVEPAPPAPADAKPLAADRLDTAPIAALRKALATSRWPEPQRVNVRTLVNAAPPAAPAAAPSDGHPFTARIESSESPLHPERRLVRVELRARETPLPSRTPATVILLLDVSGSMDAPNRLPLVQEAVGALLRRLQPEDRVGIVTYAGESRVLLPPAKLTDERAVRAAVDALEAKGRTNGGAGLREAFALAEADRTAGGEHVVILCTDGDFNMGETSEAELGALIDRHRERDVRLAIFGFGRPDRIDARLEALASRARGGSGYVNTRAEAEHALVAQLDALFAPVAEKLEASVEFDPARVARFRIVGEGGMRPVANAAHVPLVARERVLPGEALTTLLEIESAPGAADQPATADLRVRARCLAPHREPGAASAQTPYYGLWSARAGADEFAAASVDFRFAAAMAAFGEALQAGPEAGAANLDEIERWARGAVGEDAGGYRAELIAAIARARQAAKR